MRRLVLFPLIVGGLLLAACGDDSEETSAASASTTTAATATSTSPSTSTAPTAPPTTVPEPLQCAPIAFTPNSEDAASDVTATGLSCEEAEAFVRIAGQQTSAGGPDQVDVQGFHCVRVRAEEDPLPRSFYECRNGATLVTFVRS